MVAAGLRRSQNPLRAVWQAEASLLERESALILAERLLFDAQSELGRLLADSDISLTSGIELVTVTHLSPSKCTITPPSPAAQMSLADAPKMHWRFVVVDVSTMVHSLPCQRMLVPRKPATQTSDSVKPQAPLSF